MRLLLCTACWPAMVVLKCSWYSMTVILTQQWVKCQCAENIWRQTNIFLIHASTLLSDTRCSLLKGQLSIIIPLSHWWKPQERIKALLQVRSHDMTTGKTPWIPKISLINKAWLTGSSLPVWLLHVFFVSCCLWQTEVILFWRVLRVTPKDIQLQAKQIHLTLC